MSRQLVVFAVLLMGLLVGSTLAQTGRSLVPGVSVDGELGDDNLAQIYTYTADEGDSIKLTLISGDGLALGMVVSDADGEGLAQARDERANGFLVLDNVNFDEPGLYYITVFPLAVEDVPTEGAFSLSLAQSNVTADAENTPTDTVSGDDTPTAVPTDDAVTETDETPVPTPDDSEDASPIVDEDAAAVVDAVAPSQVLTSAGVEVSLTWNATVDLNLEVRDPNGGSLFWDSPSSESGGTFEGFNVNGACETFTADAPTETVSWPAGAVPTGSYEILVFYVQDCESNGAVPFTINTVIDGVPQDPISGTTLPNQVFIASFDLEESGDVTVREGGVNQGLLPASVADITAGAGTISLESPVEGVIVSEQPYEAYSFDAAAGDVLSASMNASSGNLDPYLFLIDQNGTIVAENDDANAETRDANLNAVVINQVGTYTLVATRYGQQVGGTEGNYSLNLTGATTAGGSTAEALLGVDLPEGLIEVSLIWDTNADLQLLVRDPVGDAVFDDQPLISSGGTLAEDGNVGCTVAEGVPYYYTYWPAGLQLRPGTYEIDVWFQNNCGDTTPVSPTLTVSIGGQVIISDTFSPLPGDHYITTFTIGLDGAVVRGPGGIAGGSETINYLQDLPNAAALTSDVPVQGTITDDNRFDVYTFDGTANETISLRMDATAGTLDTLLFLVGPTGIELASNDDAILNETTNSAINEFTLPQTGQYIVIATHYGTIYGGTNGAYTLQFSRLNPS